MKSHIDWNEMFPRLKKDLRETLLLEAVTLLSVAGRPQKANGDAELPVRVHKYRRGKRGQRFWRKEGDGGRLVVAKRQFKVIAANAPNPKIGKKNSKLSKIWAVLTKHGSDVVSSKSLVDLCEQAGLEPQATIAQLWRARRIDIVK